MRKMTNLNKYSKEHEFAAPVVEFIEQDGWEVFQEVRIGDNSPRADIIGRRGNIIHVVEVKKTLSLDLMAQAVEWLRKVHYVSVAIPETIAERKIWASSKGRDFAYRVMASNGIGIITIDLNGHCKYKSGYTSRLNRHCHADCKRFVIPYLTEQQKYYARAGSRDRYWTPFRETCDSLTELVGKHPEGIKFKSAIDIIIHNWHYASEQSGRSALGSFLEEGGSKVLPGINAVKEGRSLVLYPIEVEEDE